MRSFYINIGDYHSVILKSPISIISPICFNLWENGKCNSSSEEHLRNQKPIEVLI
jgi:hypothetical protein